MTIPERLDWYMWRILSSQRLTVTKTEIENRWTIDDVMDAHETLDLYQDLDVLQANEHYFASLRRGKGGK